MIEGITIENYAEKRQELVDANSNLQGVILRDKEIQLDGILSRLKEEFKNDCGGNIPYEMPVLTDPRISKSRLYGFLSKMPKGSDLHVHDMAQLPISELIKVLMNREDMYVNLVGDAYDLLTVKKGDQAPEGYKLFRDAVNDADISYEKLLPSWTVIGSEAAGMTVWDYFEELFVRHAAISSNDDFAYEYYVHALRYYCEHGIFHMEIHMFLSEDMEVCTETIKAVRAAYYVVKREYPYLTVKVIGAGTKHDDSDFNTFTKSFLNTVFAQNTIKDESDPQHPTNFIIGYDLISEEDVSKPLKDFAPMLIEAHEKYPQIKFFIHGGESLDAGNDNLIDAYLLGVSRVGHGMNLYRYPDLLDRYANSEICLEVCVISNQTLGYTTDIRVHPATEYLRRGVALALCSDDPTYQENCTLTDDFFAGTVAWDLSLSDIKLLAINSLMYSGLDEFEKMNAMKAFRKLWQEFVDRALEEFN